MNRIDASTLSLALAAFHAAVARVADAAAAVEHAMFAPLTEAAWWAISVDEGLAERDGGYKSARNSRPIGQTVAGPYYARAALGHHRAFIAQSSGGLTAPFTAPFTVTVVPRWVGTLSLPDMGDQGMWAQPYYAERLARRAVLETLADAAEWFTASAPDLAG